MQLFLRVGKVSDEQFFESLLSEKLRRSERAHDEAAKSLNEWGSTKCDAYTKKGKVSDEQFSESLLSEKL